MAFTLATGPALLTDVSEQHEALHTDYNTGIDPWSHSIVNQVNPDNSRTRIPLIDKWMTNAGSSSVTGKHLLQTQLIKTERQTLMEFEI